MTLQLLISELHCTVYEENLIFFLCKVCMGVATAMCVTQTDVWHCQ
jgi:hypothetical protein